MFIKKPKNKPDNILKNNNTIIILNANLLFESSPSIIAKLSKLLIYIVKHSLFN